MTIVIKSEFKYYAPEDLGEALEIIANPEEIVPLAGGTDLLVNMENDAVKPEAVMDIKNIPSLKELKIENNTLYIGAAVTCNQFLASREISEQTPLLRKCVDVIGSHQIRNRATIVGNVCTSSPGADIPPALLVLGASVIIVNSNEKKEVPVEEFFTGVKENILGRDELIKAVKIPVSAEDARSDYRRKTRVEGPDLSACGVAGYISRQKEVVKFGYGALAPTPKMVDGSDLFFDFSETEREIENSLDKLLDRMEETISPITDVRSTENHRRRLARVYTRRIFHDLWEEA